MTSSARERRSASTRSTRSGRKPSSSAPALHQVLVLRRVGSPGGSTARCPSRARRRGCRGRGGRGTRFSSSTRHLLDLVRRVARLEVGAERPALHRLGEDDGRRALVLDRGLVRGVELAVVVPAARQLLQVLVGEVLDHLAQPRVGSEEVLPDVRARLDRVLLELAVDGRVHLVDEHAVDVARRAARPTRGPRSTLIDVPARAAERRLELLDDLAVAAHRTVEPLQVAVHDEDQVVELLARRDRQRRPSPRARPSRRRRRSTTPAPSARVGELAV